jgi:hypothetical protein
MLFKNALILIIELEVIGCDRQVDNWISFLFYLGFIVLSNYILSSGLHSFFREIDRFDSVLHFLLHLGFCLLE